MMPGVPVYDWQISYSARADTVAVRCSLGADGDEVAPSAWVSFTGRALRTVPDEWNRRLVIRTHILTCLDVRPRDGVVNAIAALVALEQPEHRGRIEP